MNALDGIKAGIQKLYETNPHIHMSVAMTKPKINLNNAPVVIKGVYAHIFQIEEQSGGTPKTHSIPYTDVLVHQIEILELGENRVE